MTDVATSKKIHPITGKSTEVLIFINHYGPGQNGYKFKNETIMYSEEELQAMTPLESG